MNLSLFLLPYLPYEFSKVQLLKRDVPFLQIDAGLAGFAGDGDLPLVPPRAGQIVQLVAFALAVRAHVHPDLLAILLVLPIIANLLLLLLLIVLIQFRVFIFDLNVIFSFLERGPQLAL